MEAAQTVPVPGPHEPYDIVVQAPANGAMLGRVPATLPACVSDIVQRARDDEIFGPVFAIIPVDSDDEAVAVANRSSMGLNGSVFSRDLARALALGERLEVGGVVINGTVNYRPPLVPFGGVKMSGNGREGLGYTIEELSRPKFTVLRRIRRS